MDAPIIFIKQQNIKILSVIIFYMLFRAFKAVRFGLNNRFVESFSQVKQKGMKDWQYVKNIEAELRDNNINNALKYLIQSYFDKEILDGQIFNSYFKKVREQKFDITYQEIGYELYRNWFRPNHLIIDTMKQLVLKSSNQKIVALLQKDFESINQKIPTLQAQKQEKAKREKKQQAVVTEILTEVKNEAEVLEQDDQDIHLDSDLRNYIIELVRKHTQPLFPSNGRIILHNAQIKFVVPKQDQFYDLETKNLEIKEQNVDEKRQLQDQYGYPEQYYEDSRIQSIKIEKVQILNQKQMLLENKDNEKDKKP